MENLIVVPKNEKQLSLIKALLTEMKIQFKSEEVKEVFPKELEAKIIEARKEKKEGKLLTINPKKIWESI